MFQSLFVRLITMSFDILQVPISSVSSDSLKKSHSTEVGRAPLIHFQKIFFKKGFYRSKLARELKFYPWIIIAGSKSLKKGQKMLKKATNLV